MLGRKASQSTEERGNPLTPNLTLHAYLSAKASAWCPAAGKTNDKNSERFCTFEVVLWQIPIVWREALLAENGHVYSLARQAFVFSFRLLRGTRRC